MGKRRRALLSTYDKQGVVEFAQGLQQQGFQLLSSGGTAKLLADNGITVTRVSDYTGAPEMLGGRVKTIHPKICGGILARDTPEHREQLAAQQIDFIDLVCVNLYPFSETLARGADPAEILEMIDIGGPTLLRAAAKSFERVAVVVDPADYSELLAELESGAGVLSAGRRRRLAGKAFAYTAAYDGAISNYFHSVPDPAYPKVYSLQLTAAVPLRYGENPHQGAVLYRNPACPVEPTIVGCEQLQGKELSYNNILDADAALSLVLDLSQTAVCIVKHSNPCGAASAPGASVVDVFLKAKATDPISAFGGIVACNQPVTEDLARELNAMFLEAVVAPDFETSAVAILAKKKNLRLLRYPSRIQRARGTMLRSVAGGMLMQDIDFSLEEMSQARVVSKRAPTAEELHALDFAWRVCKHVKSNAIVFAQPGQLVGVGAGQMSRVDSVKLAVDKAQLPLAGTVLASDAFFPFRDGLDAAAAAGCMAVVQPGGSVRDEEVITAADEQGLAMIFTGVRHFRH